MNKSKFWNFARDETGERELHINGVIAEDMWFGDEVTPSAFRNELNSAGSNITVWINSDGGDVIAASQIYTMLFDYKGKVTAKINGMCASAASVIAMAADTVLMSPTAYMLVHDPWTVAIGNSTDLQKAAVNLDEVKEGIINAYELKTGLSRTKLSNLMKAETLMSAKTAIEHGFADSLLSENKQTAKPVTEPITEDFIQTVIKNKITIESRLQRLNLIMGRISQ
jgi:ATP-dependent Clp protease protease subunit